MIALALGAALAASPAPPPLPPSTLNAVVFIGEPGEGKDQPSVDVLPGTVLYSGSQTADDVADRDQRYQKLAKALGESYRLGKIRSRIHEGLDFRKDQTHLLSGTAGAPNVEVTLVGDAPNVPGALLAEKDREPVQAYRVRITHDGKVLAEPVVAVQPKGRAIVGTRDGKAAPYLFVVLESVPPSNHPPAARPARRVSAPKRVLNVDPKYPAEAREARVQGLVTLQCRIDVYGAVAEVKLVRGVEGEIGAKLNEAAMEAVRQWRYEPSVDENGKPRPVELTLSVNFKLPAEEAR